MDTTFTYTTAKNGKVFVQWNGKPVVTLAGDKAAKFLRQAEAASEAEAQLLMARVTGNFKRGNEKEAKNKSQR